MPMTMKDAPVVKNVEEQLLNERRYRRRPGEVPYPLKYSTEQKIFDHWDHMFLVSCCRGLTMHQFETPPPMVLDLGCGGGFWVLEAAKQWTKSTIVGFDMKKKIQPNLKAFEMYRDLASRVKWVHGNFLDPLPFPSDYFDFVRTVGIGLGVPEDEWQFVLEEISRVMKPGAVLEVIEEDLIFPTGRIPKPRPPPITVKIPMIESKPSSLYSNTSSATFISESWTAGSDQSFSSFGESRDYSPSSSPTSTISPHTSNSPSSPKSFSIFRPPKIRPEIDSQYGETQDHTRLKLSWDAMLAHRFLAPQLLKVLPFYLSSSFVEMQTHPSLQIYLPPNSNTFSDLGNPENGPMEHLERFDPEVMFDMRTPSGRKSTESISDHCNGPYSPSQKTSQRTVPSWSHMHLAKTVQTVIGCKESIWAEYKELYGNDPNVPPVTLNTRPKDSRTLSLKPPSPREGFERAWSNWENDMLDRIGMRQCIVSECAWSEPVGDRPDWRVWRNTLGSKSTQQERAQASSSELCRSLRAFVCKKPS